MKKGSIEASLYDLHAILVRRMLLHPPIPRLIKVNRPSFSIPEDMAPEEEDLYFITFKLQCWNGEFALYTCDETLDSFEEGDPH